MSTAELEKTSPESFTEEPRGQNRVLCWGSSETETQSEGKELSSFCSGLHDLPAKVNRGKKKINISDVRND
ncbi:hypothetical protein MHYP_G00251930 [Metynnis hypsauchen]